MEFEKYPRAKQLIEECNYHDYVSETNWLQMTKEEAAICLARVLLTSKALSSSSIPLVKMAVDQVDIDYHDVGNHVQVFAKEEGRAQVKLSNEEVTRLFAHIEIGGSRYLQKPIKQ